MTPARRARGFALLVLAAAVGAVGACGAWAPVPTTVETVAGDTYASFQPVTAAQLLLEGVRARERDLLVYGRDGRVKDFSADEADRGTILRFEPPADVAEIVACGLLAPKMRILRTPPADPVPPRPPDPRRLEDLGEFKITFYWVALEEPAKDEPASTPLYDPDGKEIGRFTDSFVRRVTIEGTGKLRDGRVINVSGRKGTFEVVRCPNGLGTGGYHLIPFRSVAVDREVVPIGIELYVPAAAGARLADGSIHDGRFRAHDVGGGIRGTHIDVFTGAGDRREVLERAGLRNLRQTRVYRVRRP